jgi:outer membrane protein assembly factor BamB
MLTWMLAAALAADLELAAPALAPADAWPSFRGGPTMTGASAGTLPDRAVLKWTKRFSKDTFDAGPALAGGVAYFASMEGSVFALDLASGAEKWRVELPLDGTLKPGCKGNPLLVGDALVVASDLGLVRCLDRATGKTRWEKTLDSQINSAPSLVKDRVLVGSDDGSISCFDAKTGAKQWQVPTGEKVYCSPSLVGDNILTAGCDGVLRLVALADGKVAKEFDAQAPIAATPAVAGRHVYFGTMAGRFACLDAETLKLVWENPAPDQSKREFFSSPALSADLAVVGARDKRLHAFDRKTGAEKWTFAAKGHIDASPLVAGGRAYVGAEDRRFYAVDLADGKLAWQHVCGGKLAASPALAAGRLVFADQQGNVFCFGAE